MKPAVIGTITIPFRYEIDHKDRNMAFLEAAYKLHEDVFEDALLFIRNIYNDKTLIEAMDYNVDFEDVVDEHGFSID